MMFWIVKASGSGPFGVGTVFSTSIGVGTLFTGSAGAGVSTGSVPAVASVPPVRSACPTASSIHEHRSQRTHRRSRQGQAHPTRGLLTVFSFSKFTKNVAAAEAASDFVHSYVVYQNLPVVCVGAKFANFYLICGAGQI